CSRRPAGERTCSRSHVVARAWLASALARFAILAVGGARSAGSGGVTLATLDWFAAARAAAAWVEREGFTGRARECAAELQELLLQVARESERAVRFSAVVHGNAGWLQCSEVAVSESPRLLLLRLYAAARSPALRSQANPQGRSAARFAAARISVAR